MTEPGAPKPPGVHIPREKLFLDGEGNLLAAMGVAIPEAPDMQREELRFAIAEETGSAPEDIVLAADARDAARAAGSGKSKSSAFFGSESWNSPWEPGKDADDKTIYH